MRIKQDVVLDRSLFSGGQVPAKLAYLFDPYVAVSSSAIDPLPHQISAVYEHMLPRLLIKELLIRGELERCLIVAPGLLSEQWQDELRRSSSCSPAI